MANDLLSIIKENSIGFSKGQKKIAEYISKSYDKAAFMTASKLASEVGISESTVVRFAVELSYDGYPEFQKALQELVRTKLTSVQRMQVASSRIVEGDVLSKVLLSDVENIRTTLESQDIANFNAAVDKLVDAKRIYVIGVRSSAAVASFCTFYFNYMFDNVKHIHESSSSEMFEQMLRVGEGDVVVGITFPRYSTRTYKTLDFAKKRGAQIIGITDSLLSPIAPLSDNLLIARSDMLSFVDSLVAPLSLVNALIVGVAMKKQEDVSKTFDDLEKIWDEYNVYNNSNTDRG